MQRKQGMQESQTEKEDTTAAAKDGGHDTDDKDEQIEGQNLVHKTVGGSVNCWLLIARKRGSATE